MKKMLLKSVSLFLVLLMIYSSVPVSAFATVDFTDTQTELITEEDTTAPQTEGEEPGEPIEEELPEYSYAVNEDNTLVITAYNGEEKFVTIPATIDEMTVVAIGDNAFANNTTILEVTIPESVIEIGEEAFVGCPQLRNVIIPDTVLSVSDTAFETNCNLTILSFYKSAAYYAAKSAEVDFKIVDTIEENIVTETLNETQTWRINLLSGLLYISGTGEIPNYSSASATPWYNYASSLTGLVIDDGITKIGNYAFQNFSGFKGDLIIPDTVTSL